MQPRVMRLMCTGQGRRNAPVRSTGSIGIQQKLACLCSNDCNAHEPSQQATRGQGATCVMRVVCTGQGRRSVPGAGLGEQAHGLHQHFGPYARLHGHQASSPDQPTLP